MSKRSLSRTGVVVVLALSTAIAVVFSSAASGVTSKGTDRFTPVGTGDVQASYYTPLGISKAPAVVMVQLAGKTVAEAQGEAGRPLTEAEQKQIVDQLSAQQDALKGQIQALGGTILNDFQYAYNGIKVRIARDKVSDLQKLTGVVGVHAVARVERDNVNTAPLVNVPAVWGGSPAFHGAGVKIAVIDTGIDYTHANFGGPGTVAAFNAADGDEHARRRIPPSSGRTRSRR